MDTPINRHQPENDEAKGLAPLWEDSESSFESDSGRKKSFLVLLVTGIAVLAVLLAFFLQDIKKKSPNGEMDVVRAKFASVEDRLAQLEAHGKKVDRHLDEMSPFEKAVSKRVDRLGEDFDALRREIKAVKKRIADLRQPKDVALLPLKKVEIPLTKTGDTTSQKKADVTAQKKTQAVKTEARYHKVLPGETLYRISLRYKVSVKELRRLNKLSPNEPIYTGQKLLVSSPGTK